MVEWIGAFAGFCTTISFIPQVYRVWKTRSVQDISLSMYLVFCTGVAFWVVYGLLRESYPIIVFNLITFCLSFAILCMKLCWSASSSNMALMDKECAVPSHPSRVRRG